MNDSRDEYLKLAKKRALEHLDRYDTLEAITSMMSDLRNHPELKDHKGLYIGDVLLMSGMCKDRDFVRRFIMGFN